MIFAAALVAAIGCEQKSPPGGHVSGPNNTTMGTPDMAFRLAVPATDVEVDQGKDEKFTVEVKKGKNFTQDVDVSFSGLPTGVTVSPATFTHTAADKENREITLTAAKDAPKGEYTITVIGKPKTGEATKTTMKIEVTD
jgi:hypothetical protein